MKLLDRYIAVSFVKNYLISFLVLAFALNFVVAAMNLVPLPLFDGYHLMRNGVKNQLAVRAISYIVAAAFLLTLFPWVLR